MAYLIVYAITYAYDLGENYDFANVISSKYLVAWSSKSTTMHCFLYVLGI